MGCGKTTIGKKLAKWQSLSFIDTDREVERLNGMTISSIYSKYSKNYFHEQESKVIKVVAHKNNCLIATGGDVVLNPENMRLLKTNGLIVFLSVPKERLYEHTKKLANRPDLNVPDRHLEIDRLLSEREPLYKKYSDITFNVEGYTVEESAYELIRIIRSFGR